MGNRAILAMIKADAYGHGMVRVAKALTAADALGVASIEEALILREAKVTQPIVIMSRFDHADQLSLCIRYRLAIVVHQPYQIEILENNSLAEPIDVWLKIETGMNRLGFSTEQLNDAWSRLQRIPGVRQPVGLMTHLACADIPDHPLTSLQMQNFSLYTSNFNGPRSIANSAAILAWPTTLADWVRPGIMLYGASPFNDKVGEYFGLRPVMTFASCLTAVKWCRQGETIGYGATWQCPEDMFIGVIAVGYGDGYPRRARTGTPVLINGAICPLIGRVSMDMITVDLRSQPQAKVGDPVVLWGKGLPVEQVAIFADTVAYELFCHLTRRVEFITQ